MNKLLLRSSFLISLTCLTSQSWALPPCPKDKKAYWDNCFSIQTWGSESKWKGDKYIGEFKNNRRNGQGNYIHSDGSEYIGQFKDGNYEGHGSMTWASGSKYTGQWKKHKRNGFGTYKYLSGAKYIGEYKDNKKHGQGIYTWADGRKYVGEWKDNKYHGQGTKTYADGKVEEGIWKDSKFMYAKKLTSTSNPKIEGYKSFCLEIGFTPGSEKFGECVVEAMKKD